MSYGICRVKKVKAAAVGSMQYHNDRVPGEHSNDDIEPGRTHLNYELCRHGSYRREVQDRIDRYRQSDRKVRKDAVVLVEGIVTASPEWFKQHTEEEARAFFADAYEFVKEFMGEENVVHFTVHLDETTPHAHWGATPIKDGQLAWKKFFDGKYALKAFQDRFYERVSSRYGMERGEQDTGRKHVELQQMKRDAQREIADLRQEVEIQRGETVEVERRLECLRQRESELGGEVADLEEQVRAAELEPPAQNLIQSVGTLVAHRGDGDRERALAAERSELESSIEQLERQVAAARGRVGELERGIAGLGDAIGRARERFALLVEHVRERLGGVRAISDDMSETTQRLARKMGVRVMDAFHYQMEQATMAARALNASRWHEPPSRGHHRGR